MNLRKLLCGLLALCLLLTMAPAALMEELEAPVAEVVEELGEVAEAENATDIVKNTDVTLRVGKEKVLTFEYEVAGVDYGDGSVVEAVPTGVAEQVKLVAKGAGSYAVTVALKAGATEDASEPEPIKSQARVYAIINVTVPNEDKPANINMFADKNGNTNLTGSTVTVAANTKCELYSKVYSAVPTILTYGEDYKKVIWRSSNTKVAAIARDKDNPEHVVITLAKEGTAKITATVAGTNISNSVTLKVITDNSKAKKVAIDTDGPQTLKDGQVVFPTAKDSSMSLTASVTPADYEYVVDWSVSGGTKYAYFLDNGKKVSSITWTNGNVKEENIAKRRGALKLYTTGKTGTINITAKVGKKKATLKVKLFKLGDIYKADMYSIEGKALSGKTISKELTVFDRYKGEDYGKNGAQYSKQANSFTVYGEIWSYDLQPLKSKSAITWKSSNTKVATVAKDSYNGMNAKISMKKTGTTVISMKIKSATGVTKTTSFTLKVTDPKAPKAIYFCDEDGIEIDSLTIKEGKKASIGVVAEFVDDSAMNNAMISYSQLKFSTSDKHHVTVNSSNGIITGVKKGHAYITVKTYNGLTKKLKVIVK